MARKVFISFLGAIPYEKTMYYFSNKEDTSSATPYVQKAIFEKHLLPIWQEEDSIFIFTTDDAYRNNYANRIVKFNFATQQPEYSNDNDGLESILADMKNNNEIKFYEHVGIPNGNTVDEIWTVFQCVYDKLKELPNKSEVYFDITYGFRSLPMLGIVLLNYVKTLIDIDIKYIFYGNFEVGRQEKNNKIIDLSSKVSSEELEKFKNKPTISPILDLRPFVELQDWTTAARSFLNGGNTTLLKELIAQSNVEIAEKLDIFATSLLMCRGQQLNRDFDINQFKDDIIHLQGQEVNVQLRPLLEKIQQKIQPFESKNTLNGIRSVEWCVANGLIQQGYTFLQETLKSYLIELVFNDDASVETYIVNQKIRDAANFALNGSSLDDIEKKLKNTSDANKYATRFFELVSNKHLSQYYVNLTGKGRGLRNDINHCGFQENYASPQDLIKELNSLLNQFKICLNIA